jgi:hypothetical protein
VPRAQGYRFNPILFDRLAAFGTLADAALVRALQRRLH